jgi:type VI secretion system VasD/TssJ family lipoprotein
MPLHRTWFVGPVIAAAAVAISCAKAPPPAAPPAPPPLTIAAAPDAKVRLPMTISATADVNPNARGNAQPIVVRVYQLRSDQAFLKANQQDLFDDEQKVLGPEFIGRTEYLIDPSQKQTHDINFAQEAVYVGVAAAFFDIRNAQWRQVLFTPRKGMSVAVERARLTVTPVQ